MTSRPVLMVGEQWIDVEVIQQRRIRGNCDGEGRVSEEEMKEKEGKGKGRVSADLQGRIRRERQTLFVMSEAALLN